MIKFIIKGCDKIFPSVNSDTQTQSVLVFSMIKLVSCLETVSDTLALSNTLREKTKTSSLFADCSLVSRHNPEPQSCFQLQRRVDQKLIILSKLERILWFNSFLTFELSNSAAPQFLTADRTVDSTFRLNTEVSDIIRFSPIATKLP